MKPAQKNQSKNKSFEHIFRGLLMAMGVVLLLLVLAVFCTLLFKSLPSIHKQGLGFIWGKVWDPVQNIYGALPFIVGTLLTSFIALLIATPFSFAIAFYLGEYNAKGWLSIFLKNLVELIAAVPSIIYGFWALFVLVPLVRVFEAKIGVPPYGIGIFSAALILSIMIIPYAASLGTTLIRMVPSPLKEAAYALGSTRFELVSKVIFPYTRSGLLAGTLLSLGRALGETMAVTMVIGNTNMLPSISDPSNGTGHSVFSGLVHFGKFVSATIFGPGNTMASAIANEFTEADHALYLSALIELGLVLFLVTVIINVIGKRIISRYATN